ncbi:LpqN/LpqT family lipoprotein [Mycolicibacterium baixiangningiae]|uniref:LpqN/LpqT family lipoprotein n=1 Tax=Mycolicibacterium baixiangningiae TaxID=2761578 RepID=UPI001868B674|nr:LpqN/LpqT family lipoprotein [Mycolicibacterium baixiangningiae]
MIEKARHWRVLAGGVAAGVAGLVGFAGATATAEPLFPQPPAPGPGMVAVAPAAAPAAVPESVATPGLTGAVISPSAGTVPAVVAAPTPSILPASSGTLAEFFKAKGVTMAPQAARGFTALNITLPMPPGWAYIPDPNVPEAFAVIADRVGGDGLYSSNAQLKVYKLTGDFNPDEAISHGFIDSQMLPAWRSTDASLAPYNGMPSSLIEGTYRENSMTLNTSRRHVIASSGPDRYLVSLAVTTTVDQVVPAADATDAIVTGFKVASPTAQAPIAPPPPAPAAPPAPGLAALPQPLGLP